jgi:glutamate dehydrogenase (NAD(P)+)
MYPEASEARTEDRRRALAESVRTCTIERFQQQMIDAGVFRAFVVYENGELTLSHPKLLEPVQAFLELSPDFARHEGIFIGREDGIPTLFCAFVHDTRRGLSQGGLRFTRYPNLADLLADGIRLAQGMTRKNALAGLWWGGGKGIMPLPPGYERPEQVPSGPERQALFEAYGRFIASIGGIYHTAEDVGTKTEDMDAIFSQNRFVTCISPAFGGSGNPSPHTALGVFLALQAAWQFLHQTDSLEGVRVAVQGAGNVGAPLIELLDDAGAQVWVCDVNDEAIRKLQESRPRVRSVPTDEIFDLDVDVFSPCARGAQVNRRTIPRLKARLICGAANNILEEPQDAERLQERGILFVPDYISNRMGITNCADEWLGYLAEDIRLAAERVYPDTLRVLEHARRLGITTVQAADELADVAASEVHPLHGHRGRRIINHLIASDWRQGGAEPRRG